MASKDDFYDADGEVQDEYVLRLRRPVPDPVGGGELTELQLREPTAGEMKRILKKSGTEATIEALVIITGKTANTIEKIGVRDLKKAERYLLIFTNDGPTTGDVS